MSDEQLYILEQDDDCHWYAIPEGKREEWSEWLDSDDCELGVLPSWVIEHVDPWCIRFPLSAIEGYDD